MRRGGATACRAALRDVKRVVEELGRLPRKLAVAAAPDITRALQFQFEVGMDPYGRTWAPLKPSTLRQHGPPPLTKTRKLRDGTKAIPMAGSRIGLAIHVGAKYGAFHQVGFRVHGTHVPARRILPGQGMPAAWRAMLQRRAKQIAAQITAGAR